MIAWAIAPSCTFHEGSISAVSAAVNGRSFICTFFCHIKNFVGWGYFPQWIFWMIRENQNKLSLSEYIIGIMLQKSYHFWACFTQIENFIYSEIEFFLFSFNSNINQRLKWSLNIQVILCCVVQGRLLRTSISSEFSQFHPPWLQIRFRFSFYEGIDQERFPTRRLPYRTTNSNFSLFQLLQAFLALFSFLWYLNRDL